MNRLLTKQFMMQPDTRQIYQKSNYRIIILQFYNCPIELKTPEPNAPMESSILLSLDNFATTNKRLNVILVTESYMYFENDYHMISQMTADIFPSRESLFFYLFIFFFRTKNLEKPNSWLTYHAFLLEKTFYEMVFPLNQ